MKNTIIICGQAYDNAATLTEQIGVTPLTLSRWSKSGKLPQPIKIGNKLYFNRQLVEEYLLNTA